MPLKTHVPSSWRPATLPRVVVTVTTSRSGPAARPRTLQGAHEATTAPPRRVRLFIRVMTCPVIVTEREFVATHTSEAFARAMTCLMAVAALKSKIAAQTAGTAASISTRWALMFINSSIPVIVGPKIDPTRPKARLVPIGARQPRSRRLPQCSSPRRTEPVRNGLRAVRV